MTERLSDLRQHLPARQTFERPEERSMRWLELVMALTAIGAAILIAVAH